ncbi:MAG: futalosine hydrolase [Phycisphaeraceae bacterium]|nr:MAG: futalosine hydrolase [Phycisphaeraceae bacterium]
MPPAAPPPTRFLLIAAAPAEAMAILRGLGQPEGDPPAPWTLSQAGARFDLLLCGVGKANASGATALLFDPARHCGALSLGVAGALPGSGLEIGDAVLATQSIYTDEGAATPEGFSDMASMGFPPIEPSSDDAIPGDTPMGVGPDPDLFKRLRPLTEATGPIATVSTCSGTDALAEATAARVNAIAEAMEGAAIGFTLRRRALSDPLPQLVPFAELRVISNTTGDRGRQKWDLRLALTRLSEITAQLAGALADEDR